MSTGYDFPTESEYEHEVDRSFEPMFSDLDSRHFMKKFLSSCLAGCNDYEILSFWTGLMKGNRLMVIENLHCVLSCQKH